MSRRQNRLQNQNNLQNQNRPMGSEERRKDCMGHMESLDNADREFWDELHRQLLAIVCILERYKLPDRPTTSELRKAGKKVIKVDVKQE